MFKSETIKISEIEKWLNRPMEINILAITPVKSISRFTEGYGHNKNEWTTEDTHINIIYLEQKRRTITPANLIIPTRGQKN